MRSLNLIFIIALINGCTSKPVVVRDEDNLRCNLETKKRELIIREEIKNSSSRSDVGNAINGLMLAIGSVYSATTFIVSGSVVLVGNTVHWMEKQGKCDDAFIKKSFDDYIRPLIDDGGSVIDGPSNN